MNSIVWPELLNNDKLGHQIIKDFLKKATKKEILEKIWLTIKDSDPEDPEEMASDILFIVEEALGKERCNELYFDLKQRRSPFHIKVTINGQPTSEPMYFTGDDKFSTNMNDAALFLSAKDAVDKYSEAMVKCKPLFENLKFEVEEYKNGQWQSALHYRIDTSDCCKE